MPTEKFTRPTRPIALDDAQRSPERGREDDITRATLQLDPRQMLAMVADDHRGARSPELTPAAIKPSTPMAPTAVISEAALRGYLGAIKGMSETRDRRSGQLATRRLELPTPAPPTRELAIEETTPPPAREENDRDEEPIVLARIVSTPAFSQSNHTVKPITDPTRAPGDDASEERSTRRERPPGVMLAAGLLALLALVFALVSFSV